LPGWRVEISPLVPSQSFLGYLKLPNLLEYPNHLISPLAPGDVIVDGAWALANELQRAPDPILC